MYVQYYYDQVGNKERERNERGYETSYTYDPVNRLKTITDSKNNTMEYSYDLAGNKISETNAKGYTMTYSYDKLNRLEAIKDPYNITITKNIYDSNGNVITRIDAKGYETQYKYDLANRVIKIIDPEIAELSGDKDTVKYKYNHFGEKIQETNALGNETTYKYDGGGRLLEVIDALGVSTSYTYDKEGNKLTMLSGKGKITSYSYGAFGLLVKVTNPENKEITYNYDLAGNVAGMVDKMGNETLYTYDNRNLLLTQEVVQTNDRITYDYDEIGNRIKMVDESGTTTYSYDERNMLKEIIKDGEEYISYSYDEIGNIETVTDKKGFTTTYTYDKSSRMETVRYGGNTTTYSYDDNGNRKSITYDGGVSEEYSYDKNSRLLKLTNKKPNGSIISSYSYTYDLAGRQITKTDSYGTTTYTYDEVGRVLKIEAPGKTTIYSYDKASNRETLNETYTSPQPSGYIDEITQNQIQYKQKKSEYIYSSANMLLKLVEKMYDEEGNEVIEKTTRYLYDDNGNEIRQMASYILPHNMTMHQNTKGSVHGEGVTGDISTLIEKVENTFDGFNRLKKVDRVKDGERSIVTYLYNGDGLRTRKEVQKSSEGYAKKVTNYYYDRQHVILETNEAGNLKARYVRGINYIASYGEANDISYYLYNGHGDVVQTASEAGEILNQYDYDIFGNPTLTVETYENAIRYAGEFYDEETGLYYLRARYYNPYTGRFISEDSYWGEDVNPLSQNLYTYAYNNPIKYVDPSGHTVTEWDKKNLSRNDRKKIKKYTKEWNRYDRILKDIDSNTRTYEAVKRLRDEQHENAEDIRNSHKEKDRKRRSDRYTREAERYENILKDMDPNTKTYKIIENLRDENYRYAQELMDGEVNNKVKENTSNGNMSDEELIAQLNEILTYDPSFTYNENVALMQERLNALGYIGKDDRRLAVDGKFGSNTLHAVNDFKDQNNLWNDGKYEGKVGNTTWELLFSDKAARAAKRNGYKTTSGIYKQKAADNYNEESRISDAFSKDASTNVGKYLFKEKQHVEVTPVNGDMSEDAVMDISFYSGKIEFEVTYYDYSDGSIYTKYYELYDAAEEDMIQEMAIQLGKNTGKTLEYAVVSDVIRRYKYYRARFQLSSVEGIPPEYSGIVFDVGAGEVIGATVSSGIKGIQYLDEGINGISKGTVKASFGSAEKLAGHFAKHGDEFKGVYKNADEYLAGARDVMQNGTKVSYTYKDEIRTGYVRFMGNNSKGVAKFEFVGTNNLGDITTYHVESGRTFWKMLNGENVKIINPID